MWEREKMAFQICSRIFGNGIKLQTHGYSAQTLEGQDGAEQLDFLLVQKDILALAEMAAERHKISGNGTKLPIHGRRNQTLAELHVKQQLDSQLEQKDI